MAEIAHPIITYCVVHMCCFSDRDIYTRAAELAIREERSPAANTASLVLLHTAMLPNNMRPALFLHLYLKYQTYRLGFLPHTAAHTVVQLVEPIGSF